MFFAGPTASLSMRPPPMTTLVSAIATEYLVCILNHAPVATLNPATMETLQLFRGDTIIVRYVFFPLHKDIWS